MRNASCEFLSDLAMALRVSNLHKHFGVSSSRVEVLKGISFEMSDGESLAITGPSGSGKSTLLHCLGALTAPSSGEIDIGGRDPFELPEPDLARFRNRVIGFVFQEHHLLPQYSVVENVLMPALAFPDPDANPEERARELLEKVGLNHRLDHRPGQLSGGERQRVAVARALMNRPLLLLCDEPTGNLDHATARSVTSLIFDLHREEERILIIVTHNLELAAEFPRHFELREGKCVAV